MKTKYFTLVGLGISYVAVAQAANSPQYEVRIGRLTGISVAGHPVTQDELAAMLTKWMEGKENPEVLIVADEKADRHMVEAVLDLCRQFHIKSILEVNWPELPRMRLYHLYSVIPL